MQGSITVTLGYYDAFVTRRDEMPSFVTAGSIVIFAIIEIATVQTSLGQSTAPQSSSVSAPSSTQPESVVTGGYVPTITYDVVSVRKTNPDYSSMVHFGGEKYPWQCLLRVENIQYGGLLALAYRVTPDQISGVPIRSLVGPYAATYNVEAKCDDAGIAKLASLSKDQQVLEQQHMVQALLADRFALKAHWETRDGSTYNLVLTKRGRLRESVGEPPSAEEIKHFGDHPIPVLYQRNDGKGYDYVAHGASIKDIVQVLSAQMGRPVTDSTGLVGKYDFVLQYYGRTEDDHKVDDLDPTPPLDQAIQDQLGLKLERKKGSTRVLVIDHIEKASEN